MFRVFVLLEGLKSFADINRFSSRIVLYLAPSNFLSNQTIFSVPAEEKNPRNVMTTLFLSGGGALRVMCVFPPHIAFFIKGKKLNFCLF